MTNHRKTFKKDQGVKEIDCFKGVAVTEPRFLISVSKTSRTSHFTKW